MRAQSISPARLAALSDEHLLRRRRRYVQFGVAGVDRLFAMSAFDERYKAIAASISDAAERETWCRLELLKRYPE